MNHHYIQLGYQLADCVSGFAYSFFGSCIILFLINLVPGLSLRASEEAEILGIDDAEIGEFAVSSLLPRNSYSLVNLSDISPFSSTTTLKLLARL